METITGLRWFDNRRRLGWGWRPITWQGWSVVGVFTVLAVVAGSLLRGRIPLLILAEGVLVAALLAVCYLTGGPPGSAWLDKDQ